MRFKCRPIKDFITDRLLQFFHDHNPTHAKILPLFNALSKFFLVSIIYMLQEISQSVTPKVQSNVKDNRPF